MNAWKLLVLGFSYDRNFGDVTVKVSDDSGMNESELFSVARSESNELLGQSGFPPLCPEFFHAEKDGKHSVFRFPIACHEETDPLAYYKVILPI